jgi:hypothetical protein
MKAVSSSGLLQGIRRIMGYLKILSRTKELYMIEFEQSTIKQIPPELSQNHLPMSFKFYDPILPFTR